MGCAKILLLLYFLCYYLSTFPPSGLVYNHWCSLFTCQFIKMFTGVLKDRQTIISRKKKKMAELFLLCLLLKMDNPVAFCHQKGVGLSVLSTEINAVQLPVLFQNSRRQIGGPLPSSLILMGQFCGPKTPLMALLAF